MVNRVACHTNFFNAQIYAGNEKLLYFVGARAIRIPRTRVNLFCLVVLAMSTSEIEAVDESFYRYILGGGALTAAAFP